MLHAVAFCVRACVVAEKGHASSGITQVPLEAIVDQLTYTTKLNLIFSVAL